MRFPILDHSRDSAVLLETSKGTPLCFSINWQTAVGIQDIIVILNLIPMLSLSSRLVGQRTLLLKMKLRAQICPHWHGLCCLGCSLWMQNTTVRRNLGFAFFIRYTFYRTCWISYPSYDEVPCSTRPAPATLGQNSAQHQENIWGCWYAKGNGRFLRWQPNINIGTGINFFKKNI